MTERRQWYIDHGIYCPKCGKRIMLCSECPARDGDYACDWEEGAEPACWWENFEEEEHS